MSDEHDAWAPVLLAHAGLMFDHAQAEAMKELHVIRDGLCLELTPAPHAGGKQTASQQNNDTRLRH